MRLEKIMKSQWRCSFELTQKCHTQAQERLLDMYLNKEGTEEDFAKAF